MRLLLSIAVAVLALGVFAVALPTLCFGAAAPSLVAATDAQAGRGLVAAGHDLAVDGVLMHNGSLADHRIDGVYHLPLVDAGTAAALAEHRLWAAPAREAGGRIVVVRLPLESVPASGLPWDETIVTPGVVGSFRASGGVVVPRAAAVQDLLWQRLGLRPDDVIVVEHGVPSFGRTNAAIAAGIGLLLVWFAVRLRRPRRHRRGPEAGGRSLPWGGFAAAGIGLVVVGARLADALAHTGAAAVRAVDTQVDAAAGLVRRADPALGAEQLLGAAKTAKDLAPFADFAARLAGTDALRLTVVRGTEYYARGSGGSFALMAGEARVRLAAGDVTEEHTLPAAPNAERAEFTRLTFRRTAEGTVEVLVERDREPAFTLPAVFVAGTFDDLQNGGNADVVTTAAGAQRLAEADAAVLQQRCGSGAATVHVTEVRTPRFLVRGRAMLVEVADAGYELRPVGR